jgi:hypothetical protein
MRQCEERSAHVGERVTLMRSKEQNRARGGMRERAYVMYIYILRAYGAGSEPKELGSQPKLC